MGKALTCNFEDSSIHGGIVFFVYLSTVGAGELHPSYREAVSPCPLSGPEPSPQFHEGLLSVRDGVREFLPYFVHGVELNV